MSGLCCILQACPVLPSPLEEFWGMGVCPESGSGTPRPELPIGKTLGITYELDLIPWQDYGENDQANVLFINTEKKRQP